MCRWHATDEASAYSSMAVDELRPCLTMLALPLQASLQDPRESSAGQASLQMTVQVSLGWLDCSRAISLCLVS